MLRTYRELTDSAPRELTAAVMLRLAQPMPFIPSEWHGKPIAGIAVCHSGQDAEADLALLRSLGDPIVDVITEKPYTEQQSMLDRMNPKGRYNYWKTEFLPSLSDEFLATFKEDALKVTAPMSYSIIFHLAGALNERADDEGAVGNRDAKYVSGFSGGWPPDAPGDEHVAWVRDSWERMKLFSTGGNYVNFQLAEDGSERTAGAYRDNLDRLRRVKETYDPGNLFRVNRNIQPMK